MGRVGLNRADAESLPWLTGASAAGTCCNKLGESTAEAQAVGMGAT